MKHFLLLAVWLTLTLSACVPQQRTKPGADAALPRANPAYVQWLERQSMLRTAALLTAQVSGTERLLRAASVDAGGQAGDRLDTLLAAADTWLWVHAPTLLTTRMRPVWEELGGAETSALISALGLRGIYTAPTGESGSIWEYDKKASTTGEDVISLDFASGMGREEAFARFAAEAASRQWQLGMDVLPAATGLGPDFFLAARGVRDFPGLYMMLEAPEDIRDLLPPASSPWQGTILDDEALQPLQEKGLVPPALARDHLPWSVRGGWAATGHIRGADGVQRRWIYRFHGEAGRTPLNWDDPSGNARKVLSASIIKQVGILQQTLVGVHLEALLGLDAVPAGSTAAPTLEPAPSALKDMAREIRRYGGWSLQWDLLPAPLIPTLLQSGTDFTADSVTSPAAEQALRSGQTKELREALRLSLTAGLDQRRLLRLITGLDGPALLCADEKREKLEAKHKALALFRGALPGLLFVSGQDLAGTLPLDAPLEQGENTARGAWTLLPQDSLGSVSRQGLQRAPQAYASVQVQLQTPGSFAETLARMTQVRQKYGVARARVLGLASTTESGSLGLVLALPGEVKKNALMVLVCNFSAHSIKESFPLPRGGRVLDMLNGTSLGETEGTLRLNLAPYEVRWLRVE